MLRCIDIENIHFVFFSASRLGVGVNSFGQKSTSYIFSIWRRYQISSLRIYPTLFSLTWDLNHRRNLILLANLLTDENKIPREGKRELIDLLCISLTFLLSWSKQGTHWDCAVDWQQDTYVVSSSIFLFFSDLMLSRISRRSRWIPTFHSEIWWICLPDTAAQLDISRSSRIRTARGNRIVKPRWYCSRANKTCGLGISEYGSHLKEWSPRP